MEGTEGDGGNGNRASIRATSDRKRLNAYFLQEMSLVSCYFYGVYAGEVGEALVVM